MDSLTALLAQEIASTLAIPSNTVTNITIGKRFAYGSLVGEHPLFVKVSLTDEARTTLANEASSWSVCRKLGVPVVPVYSAAITSAGNYLIMFENLDMDQGVVLNPELLFEVSPSVGKRYAEAVASMAGKELDAQTASFISRNHFCAASTTHFRTTVNAHLAVVFERQNSTLLDKLAGNAEELLTLAIQTFDQLHAQIAAEEREGRQFLSHGDAAPNNMYLPNDPKQPTLMMDLEWAGASTSRLLARLVDFGNCYARLWPNPPAQREFLATLAGDRELGSEFARKCAIFGTLYLTQYTLAENHPEHAIAVALLGGLRENLKSL